MYGSFSSQAVLAAPAAAEGCIETKRYIRSTKIYIKNSDYIFHSLSNLEDVYDSSLINFFIRQREMSLKRFEHNNFIETIMIEQEPIFVKKFYEAII